MKIIILIILIFINSLEAKDYRKNKKTVEFINFMVKEHNYKRSYLNRLFSNVIVQKTPLKAYTKVKTKPTKQMRERYPLHGAWDRYVKYKVTDKRINDGISFLNKYSSTFVKVEQTYGVPAVYIAAIIGIESVYGANVGKYPVFDTLATLAFEDNRRNKFFTKELEKFIRLSYKHKINPKKVKGSYAGAIGLGQFMPSSYEAYGVDFNKDGKVSLQDPKDAIASVANYLDKNGWRTDEHVATRVSYDGMRFDKYKTGYNRTYHRKNLKGIRPKDRKWNYNDKVRLIKLSKSNYDELWYAAKNFYVITRYNHSAYYAMSVHQLAQKISKRSKLEYQAKK
ncbi:MAG: lytic murein transglycosylase B [Campylobacterota bacterium]|nr:lytic murein transglycosylase B [Campylobacterota bacterium]